jgi:hypothetical protein
MIFHSIALVLIAILALEDLNDPLLKNMQLIPDNL